MSSLAPLPPVSAKTGAGAVWTPPDERQLAVRCCRVVADLVLVLRLDVGIAAALPRRRVVGRQVSRDTAHALEVDPAEVDPTEVERDQRQEQEDGQDDRELDEALASAAAMTVDAAGPASVAGGGEGASAVLRYGFGSVRADARRGTFHGPFNRCAAA